MGRLEAQSLLRGYITDLEMVQKIIFVAVVVGSAVESVLTGCCCLIRAGFSLTCWYMTYFYYCTLFQECFQAAKLAYRQFKLRVRKTLSPSHYGPESLEDAAVDYIVRNLDLYDVQTSVNVRQTPSSERAENI